MEINEAIQEDILWVADLEQQLFSRPRTLTDFTRAYEQGDIFLVGSYLRDGVQNGVRERVGYLLAQGAADFMHVETVGVHPNARRKGYGRALLKALLVRAERRGIHLLTLEVRASNHPALSLYLSEGWKVVGRRRGYYVKPLEDAMIVNYVL